MTDGAARFGWFESVPPDGLEGARDVIENESTELPKDWPTRAVESDFAADESDYYDKLHDATTAAMRAAAREAGRADDQQLTHSVRAIDDAERVANEVAERAVEWGESLFEDLPAGLTGARAMADREPTSSAEERAISLARRAAGLADEADALRAHVERTAPSVAPNLAEMAGPVLAARLIALAGGLESLAKKPSGTVQVIGAEDALFAHLAGRAPSPKHGVIYTHEAVRGTRLEDRGSAARALAGKLSIAARVDHYAGDLRPSIHEDLRDRVVSIRARADDEAAGESAEGGE